MHAVFDRRDAESIASFCPPAAYIRHTVFMTTGWDDAAVRHLEKARNIYDDAGAIEFLQTTISEVWRDNRSRWSPRRHFDDTNTLGYQTSRNVNNRISATFDASEISTSVVAEVESGIPLLSIATFRLRVIKAPIESGLNPNFLQDFDWSISATRQAAAQRNSANYYPFNSGDWTLEFESDPRPAQKRRIDRCRDLFLLWAAALYSDATSAWLGLPRAGDVPWLGVINLWTEFSAGSEPDLDPGDEPDDEPDEMTKN